MKVSILSALAIAMLPVLSYAGDTDKGLSNIKTAWKPFFQDNYVEFSITNDGDKPINIYPKLGVIRKDSNPNVAAGYELFEKAGPSVIYPILEFMPPPGNANQPSALFNVTGAQMVPYDVSVLVRPGETKTFKFNIQLGAIEKNKQSLEFRFLLRFNGKEISQVLFRKKDSIWNEVK